MSNEKILELIRKYNSREASAPEIEMIEKMIEQGEIQLEQLSSIASIQDQLMTMEFPSASDDLDDRFYQMLALEKKSRSGFSWQGFLSSLSWPTVAPKLAFAAVALFIGVAVGYFAKPATPSQDIQQLTSQVNDLKEMMMLSLLEKESATDRLKAVSLTEQMGAASAKVTDALLKTLNNDPNVNVRLAALDALKPYAQQSRVREELIRSIAKQDSPLVQVSLAELMEQLQAKSSVKELEKIIQSDKTPTDVKNKIKQTIDVLI
jgi:hypothetical protein